MLDVGTLVFVVGLVLLAAGVVALLAAFGESVAEASTGTATDADDRALAIGVMLIGVAGGVQWANGTWAGFAWPIVVILAVLALLAATASIRATLRLGVPVAAALLAAALLAPLF